MRYTDGAEVLADVCAALDTNARDTAAILTERYPFVPQPNAGRRYSYRELVSLFRRDGFLDRYAGRQLVFPARSGSRARLLPEQFPFHPNWKTTDACHFAF
jgi:hypothetical protein